MERETILALFRRMWYHILTRFEYLRTLITNKTSWKEF